MAEREDLRAENLALRAQIAALETELAGRPRVERTPMFALLDALPTLVAAIDSSGAAEFFSAAFKPWLAVSRAQAVGRPLLEALIPNLRPAAANLMAQAAAGQMFRKDITVADDSGLEHYLQVTIVPRRLGGLEQNGWVWVIQDQTSQRQIDAALRASERRMSLAAEAAGLGIWDRDLVTGVLLLSDRAKAIYGLPADEDVTYDTLVGFTHPDDFLPADDTVRRALDPTRKEKAPLLYRILRRDGSVRWLQSHGEAVFEDRDGVETAVRFVGAIQDITDATLAAQRQAFLMNELNHRVKNTLASVQSIAHQTLRNGQSPDDTRRQLSARLIALAGAHDILTRENWEAADLGDIVGAAVEPYDATTGRFHIEGPPVRIAPKAAVAMALALHELVTNAVKYGSLSVDRGCVHIRWRVEVAQAETLVLDWLETDGPRVVPPARTGFGTRLLQEGLVTEFGGQARLAFEPTGLTCHIEAPLGGQPILELG